MLTIVLVLCFAAVHLLRRAPGYPLNADAGPRLAPGVRIRKYEIGARLFHCGNLLFVAGLTVSGVAGYSLLELERAGLTEEQAIAVGLAIDRTRNSALGCTVIQLEKLRRARGWKRI